MTWIAWWTILRTLLGREYSLVKQSGYKVVLTADRTLMADYKLLFDGMLAASQTSSIPPWVTSDLLMPWNPSADVRALTAPLGLRRIEAALLAGGFIADEVTVVDERRLNQAVGTDTAIVAVSSGEPAGHGMNSSTMTEISGGQIFPLVMFERLMNKVQETLKTSHSKAKVVMGGPGAWQIAGDPGQMRKLGIDYVISGYAEGNVTELFRRIIEGQELDSSLTGSPVAADAVPCICGASSMGVVEISRGCGLGCAFCTIARVPMIHLPEATVVADVLTNIRAGISSIAILSEDFFRYGSTGTTANPDAVISLLTKLRQIEGLRLIQTDHANVLSISQFSDEQLKTIHDLLVGDTGCEYPWVNVGVETISGELLKANGGSVKMGRSPVEHWGAFAAEQLRRLCKAGFMPMVSLVVGLPGESPQDVQKCVDWVKSIAHLRITVFPVLYAPIDGAPGLRVKDMSRLHWQLVKESYKLNFQWIPRMYWDNQKAAGVPAGRRALLQVLGRGQVLQWNALFALHGLRAKG